jgi:hypothetical protein
MSMHDNLLDRVLQANKAALQMRQAVECRIESRCDKPKLTFTAHYWRKGELLLIRETGSDYPGHSDGLYRDGISLKVYQAPDAKTKQLTDGAVRQAGREPFYMIDPPFACNETFFHAGRRDATLEQFVRAPGRTVKAIEARQAGRALVRLDVDVAQAKSVRDSGKYEIWLDPAVNYLVRKVIWHMSGPGGQQFDREVLQFKEAVPGLFVPVEMVHTMHSRGAIEQETKFVVQDWKVNQDIPESVFRLTIPPGASVLDNIRGQRYDQPAPGAAPVAVEKVPPQMFMGATVRSPLDPGPTSWNESRANTGGLNTYYAAAILCVALAAGLVAWRWRRNRTP